MGLSCWAEAKLTRVWKRGGGRHAERGMFCHLLFTHPPTHPPIAGV